MISNSGVNTDEIREGDTVIFKFIVNQNHLSSEYIKANGPVSSVFLHKSEIFEYIPKPREPQTGDPCQLIHAKNFRCKIYAISPDKRSVWLEIARSNDTLFYATFHINDIILL